MPTALHPWKSYIFAIGSCSGKLKLYADSSRKNYDRLFGDLGIFSCNQRLGENVSTLFNELTGPSGIRAKFNPLQDKDKIRQLYLGSQAGIPITLNIRELCCLPRNPLLESDQKNTTPRLRSMSDQDDSIP